ncbi:kinase-like domain-containing protein [Gymnopilus junonius]|uniref:Kinase-like domain-containing protein n=1 Tax=Gymnopilus junonius TaxID=109634 RepID=A0A9P5NSY0_GYMJU|nr:kinase-like domain-containing protein [Gymnopilus junonius]
MSTLTHSAGQSTPLAAGAQDSMFKSFIGAVEDEWQLYSDNADDYTIGEPIGFGASSIVYAAKYNPSSPDSTSGTAKKSSKSIPCALKVLDLDSLPPRSLQLLQRETTLMSLSKHPNVLRVRGSWMDGHKLYIALRLMNKGSAADIMRYGWPGGMEEDVVRCILRQALQGLNYLHVNGFIHRDVKAANLLIDDDGTVLLGDLGVSANLAEDTSHNSSSPRPHSISAAAALVEPKTSTISDQSKGKNGAGRDGASPVVPRPTIGKRKSFVGTPCWMSPELIQGKQYDSSSDIWSFGITALELTQGRPPRSRESPQRVLLRTIQEDPPTLNREGVFKYSRAFKEVVDSCLVKDPTKRPTAAELLQTPFFKAAKKKSYLINTILKDLPPLTQRQERRAVPPVKSTNSIDSWDFATTVNSPTTSVYRRRVLEELVSAENKSKSSEFFEIEDVDRIKPNPHNRRGELEDEMEVPITDENEFDPDIVPSSSPSTSVSSVLSSDVAASQMSSQPATSAPSSYTSSPGIAYKPPGAHSILISDSSAPLSLSSIEEYGPHRTLVDLKTIVSESSPVQRSSNFRPSISPGASKVWNKIKHSVGRPSGDRLDGSHHKEKDKGRINGMLSSASKSLLSRGSSRSLSSIARNEP